MVHAIPRKTLWHRTAWLVAVLLLVVAATGLLISRQVNNRSALPVTSSLNHSSVPTTGKGSAPSTTENSSGTAAGAGVAPVPSTPQAPTISVTITRVSTQPAQVYTLVYGTTTGSCTLTATQTGQPTVTASSAVAANVNAYECQDFGLAANQFASGHWHIVVALTSSGTTVNSDPWDL